MVKEKEYKKEDWENLSQVKTWTDPQGHKLKIRIHGKYEYIVIPCKNCNKEYSLTREEVEALT